MNKFPDYKKVSTESLIPYARNARVHSDAQVAQIAASIREFGFLNPIIIDGENGIIAGHGRVLAAQKLGIEELPCIEASHLTEAQRRAYVIADNKLAMNASWDDDLLRIEFDDLRAEGFDIALIGFDDDEMSGLLGPASNPGVSSGGAGSLSERFMVPPFSILNAREGWWQARKNAWIGIGIKSESGRDDMLTFSTSSQPPSVYKEKERYEATLGRKTTWDEFSAANPGALVQTTTSIFDPVLCELVYRWFTPPGGIDPFAGGSVRGIVAAKLGLQYIGCDISTNQVEANRSQGDEICAGEQFPPIWHCGDSRNIDKTCKGVEADFVFSCPPYADLEVYSDNPDDLSTLAYDEFRDAYFEIIKRACGLLKQDRFAAFVVGEVRDKRGNYYDFVGDTVQAFRDAGLSYYNEAILVTAAGSLP